MYDTVIFEKVTWHIILTYKLDRQISHSISQIGLPGPTQEIRGDFGSEVKRLWGGASQGCDAMSRLRVKWCHFPSSTSTNDGTSSTLPQIPPFPVISLSWHFLQIHLFLWSNFLSEFKLKYTTVNPTPTFSLHYWYLFTQQHGILGLEEAIQAI